MTLKKLFSCIIAVSCSLMGFARQYNFYHYTSIDGLPDDCVTCSVQDKFGFMWFGTKNGLVRFDGSEFYTPEIKTKGLSPLKGMTLDMVAGEDGVLWISSTNGIGMYNLMTDEVRTIFSSSELGLVFQISLDKNGKLWMLSSSQFCMYDPVKAKLTQFKKEDYFKPDHFCIGSDGILWATVAGGYVYWMKTSDYSYGSLKVLPDTDDGLRLVHVSRTGDNVLLVTTSHDDVIKVNTMTGESRTLVQGNNRYPAPQIWEICPLNDKEYWVGDEYGLIVIGSESGAVERISSDPNDAYSLSNDHVRSITMDSEGNVWIGTFYRGLNLWRYSDEEYYRSASYNKNQAIKGNIVRSICQVGSEIWAGTEDGYLNIISSDGFATTLGVSSGLPAYGNYHAITTDGNIVWTALYTDGLYALDEKTRKVVYHFPVSGKNCTEVQRIAPETLLLGTDAGLYVFDTRTKTLTQKTELGSDFIHAVANGRTGNVWIGTYGDGVWNWDLKSDKITKVAGSSGSVEIKNAYVTDFYEDVDGTLWMSTEGLGLCYLIVTNGEYDIRNLTMEDGFETDITCAIVPVSADRLVVSSTGGVVEVDTHSKSVIPLDVNKKIVGCYYRYGSAALCSDGRIYMGTTGGMIAFHPDNEKRVEQSNVFVTDIRADSMKSPLHLSEEGKSVITSEKIRVKHKNASVLILSFASVSPSSDEKETFKCELKRGKKQISSTSVQNHISFSDLDAGNYSFDIYGEDNNESLRHLDICIVPPLYASKMAKLIYELIILAMVGVVIMRLRKRRIHSQEMYAKELEREKQKEISDAKIDFFTSITHDIRTPLTLIRMPLDKILENDDIPERDKEDLHTIKSNADRLFDLVNQLLDFRKVESKQLKLSFKSEDMCALTKSICSCFETTAKELHIGFIKEIPETPVHAMCARSSVDKIITNLISNAFKYGEDSIKVSLIEKNESVIVEVFSDGEPIAGQNRDKIFEPFYQAASKSRLAGSKGTGLGLAFARSLVELHNGKLYLSDKNGSGNTFVFEIPKKQEDAVQLRHESSDDQPVDESEYLSGTRDCILIVEDDRELNNYIKKDLSDTYDILQAFNGEDAMNVVKKHRVDLIVSDIMMPLMDGYQLCQAIKSDFEYSHIPVILLTSVVGSDTQIKTLLNGADAYLEKPFKIKVLKASIENLFNKRDLLFKQFTDSPLSHFRTIKTKNPDDDFISKFHECILKHMSDSDLCIDMILEELGTSKSTLFRKVKANTGMNINEYIKVCRLNKAAEMLSEQKYRINEVAYLVGFSSPSYFAMIFQKQFNISPSAFVKKVRGVEDDNSVSEDSNERPNQV